MKWLLIALSLVVLLVAGCQSSANPEAPDTKSAHEPGWKFTHDSKAKEDLVRCQVCHGANFTGNGTVPSCYECHLGGPPFFIHPPALEPALQWKHPVNHGSAAKINIKGCQGCHGRRGGPGSNPAYDMVVETLEKGCESAAGCHNNKDLINSFENGHNPGAGHPAYDPHAPEKQDRRHWYGENIVYRTTTGAQRKTYLIGHYNAANITTSCTLCHGARLKGHAEGAAGPACTDCHVLDPILYPSRCVSCHGPLPGQSQAGPLLRPSQLAALAGRTDLHRSRVFQTFTSELGHRIKRDPSYVRITPGNPRSGFYFEPTVFVSFSSVINLSNRASHLHHDTLSCSERKDNATCSTCHNERRNDARHHVLMFTKGLGCTNCHRVSPRGEEYSVDTFRYCRNCHWEHFCP